MSEEFSDVRRVGDIREDKKVISVEEGYIHRKIT